MRKPIKIYNMKEDEPSASIKIKCSVTGQLMEWNEAARNGWTWDYDVNRPIHTQYYSNQETK